MVSVPQPPRPAAGASALGGAQRWRPEPVADLVADPGTWLEPAMAANGIGTFDWDIQRDVIVGDERARRVLGLSGFGEGFDARTFLDLLHPDDRPVVRRRVRRAVADLGQCGAYYRTLCAGEGMHAVRFRGRVVPDQQGLPGHMVGFVWDATAELNKRLHTEHLAVLREERTRFIKETARALSDAVSVHDVARVFTELPLPGIPPDGLVLAVLENGRIQIQRSIGYRDGAQAPDHIPMDSDHPAALALRTRTPVFLGSPREYRERFPDAWPMAAQTARRSWVFLPLVASGRTLGLCVVSFDEDRELDAEDRTLLGTLGGMVAQSLARARLHDAEHELAAGLQRVLLPRRIPPLPGFTTAVRYLPAGTGLQIGGDWYDVVPLPAGHVGVVIGDVQGHDVHAAGVMGQLRIALRAYAAEGHPPDAVMARASRFLADLDTGHFATCLYAEVNVDYGAVYAVRAGHLEPLVRRADGSSGVQSVAGGLPLGIDPEGTYPVTRFTLDPGEVLLLCTDGLVETRTVDQDQGMERIRQAIAGPQPQGPAALEALAGRIEAAAADSHERDDDIALLLLRWDGPEGHRPRTLRRRVPQADLARISEVRRELRDAVRRWGVGELADTVELLTSELITNALVHTDKDALLTARLFQESQDVPSGPARLRVEVDDESDLWPKRRTPGEQASSGRGLMLVEALADAWGVDPRGSGKRMWFELAWAPAAT
ncbi:SpoIIE family protein phosphatase [Streptacidiphilus sp. 4-A2]|nr:SpoIIE family protein phosphatase [Streptacidiphilus sp. 4-A2]